jgi:hypothetical protein
MSQSSALVAIPSIEDNKISVDAAHSTMGTGNQALAITGPICIIVIK